jgi:hypothetical protein
MMAVFRAAVRAAFLIPAAAFAFDSNKWGHDPETSAWFQSLKNQNGLSCCACADGSRLRCKCWAAWLNTKGVDFS